MEENNRKFRAPKPLRALHQNNIIWKRKRTSQDNGELTFKRLKHCSPINEETMMELDAREGKRDSKITCIFCRQWSGGLEGSSCAAILWPSPPHFPSTSLPILVSLLFLFCGAPSLLPSSLTVALLFFICFLPFADFAWHVEQAHGIPAHVGKCLVNKLMVSRELGGEKFMNAHYKCIPQFVLDHQQDLSDCE